MNRWYVEIMEGDMWRRLPGRWIFEAAIVKARETAISKGSCTRLVRAWRG